MAARDNRIETLRIRVSPAEKALFAAQAKKMGLTLSGYIRLCAMQLSQAAPRDDNS